MHGPSAPCAQTSSITVNFASIDEAFVFATVGVRSQIEPIFVIVLVISYGRNENEITTLGRLFAIRSSPEIESVKNTIIPLVVVSFNTRDITRGTVVVWL